jgi:hypothetical protein
MTLLVSCPACTRTLKVPEHLLEQLVKCPLCGQQFTARNEIEPAPSAVPAAANPTQPEPVSEVEPEPVLQAPARPQLLAPHRGVLILTLGILSICMSGMGGWIMGPIAWWLGSSDLEAMRLGRMDRAGEGMTRGGYVCGIIGTVLAVLSLCTCGLFGLGGIFHGHRHFP